MENKNNRIIVSNKLIEIFLTINKMDKTEDIKKLPKKEIYTLLLLSIENYSATNEYIVKNCTPFEEEFYNIYKAQLGKGTDDPYLKMLMDETDSIFINSKKILDEDGEVFPNLASKSSIRKYKIKTLNI